MSRNTIVAVGGPERTYTLMHYDDKLDSKNSAKSWSELVAENNYVVYAFGDGDWPKLCRR